MHLLLDLAPQMYAFLPVKHSMHFFLKIKKHFEMDIIDVVNDIFLCAILILASDSSSFEKKLVIYFISQLVIFSHSYLECHESTSGYVDIP